MRLETLFGITHDDRIRSALSLTTNEVIESSFCDKTEHYCQIDKSQLPWSLIVQPKLILRSKRINSFIREKLHINCGCFIIYKFLNSQHKTMINRRLDKGKRKLLTYTLNLKEITNEFPFLEKLFFEVQNVDRFKASKMLVASLSARRTTNNNGKRIRFTRLMQTPRLYLNPLIGGKVVKTGGVQLVLSLPLDISKFVMREKIGRCLHTSVSMVSSNDRSHDEGESFYTVCNLCYKTINKLA